MQETFLTSSELFIVDAQRTNVKGGLQRTIRELRGDHRCQRRYRAGNRALSRTPVITVVLVARREDALPTLLRTDAAEPDMVEIRV